MDRVRNIIVIMFLLRAWLNKKGLFTKRKKVKDVCKCPLACLNKLPKSSSPQLGCVPAGPALVGEVRKESASHNSIALSWSQAEQPPSNIVDYEVKYYEKVEALIIITGHKSAAQFVTVNGTRKGAAELLHPQCSVRHNIHIPKCADPSVKCCRLCCVPPLHWHLIGWNECVASQTSL